MLHNDTVILCTSGEANSGRAVGKPIKRRRVYKLRARVSKIFSRVVFFFTLDFLSTTRIRLFHSNETAIYLCLLYYSMTESITCTTVHVQLYLICIENLNIYNFAKITKVQVCLPVFVRYSGHSKRAAMKKCDLFIVTFKLFAKINIFPNPGKKPRDARPFVCSSLFPVALCR